MKKKQNYSREKYQEKMVFDINTLLRRDFRDPRLSMITVTHVELSPDYSHAKVFWDTFDVEHRGECKAAIEGIAGKMRTKLAKLLEVRHTPQLHFSYNSQYEDEQKITNLLNDSDDE